MFYVSLALCAVVTAFFVCRYYAAKTLLVEKDIEKAISRKLASSGIKLELANVQEENAVMRNLLLDLLENEAALPIKQSTVSRDEFVRMKTAKIQRYREILAESAHVLRQSQASHVAQPSSSINSDDRSP
ncbi:hypothetical protein [Rhizobium sp. RM]|uniref:hypothetical protein n=1 Tax=Rhizobium sp. RM TaxID=2748079 RepID=UPI00110DC4C7|nr:hypothetical protein [Rhizobium sp. RM]TMV20254.1 hypothetical protein BJG94_09510 [Rhizobium sp. Td3]